MDLNIWIAFIISTSVVIAIPGPTVLLVVSHAVTHGSRLAMGTVSAIALANVVQIALSYLGLAALLSSSDLLFNTVKVCGAGYLMYIGVRMFRSDASLVVPESQSSSGLRLVREGFFSTLLNPKSFIFVISFFPQFMQPDQPSLPQIIILTITFLIVGISVISIYVVIAGRIGTEFRNNGRLKILSQTAGSMLFITGLVALFARGL